MIKSETTCDICGADITAKRINRVQLTPSESVLAPTSYFDICSSCAGLLLKAIKGLQIDSPIPSNFNTDAL